MCRSRQIGFTDTEIENIRSCSLEGFGLGIDCKSRRWGHLQNPVRQHYFSKRHHYAPSLNNAPIDKKQCALTLLENFHNNKKQGRTTNRPRLSLVSVHPETKYFDLNQGALANVTANI
jgi:hypothetical protein